MILSPKRVVPPLLLGLLLGLPGLSGCSTPFSDPPPIPDSTFTRVLVDLHLTTARKKHSSDVPTGIRDSVFAYYGIEREDFDDALDYYSKHPRRFETLYDAVIDTLNALQNRYPRRRVQKDEVVDPPQSEDRP